ncbi:hypothetical protein [Plantactinospora sp. BB1]|uniref:hypothetical protein n=1 Tax=Plantactinospora sp. BB1 TaxID=2071627 RepID=UPI000D17A070|nr:hypothetical protein [Plantactinospora sp. BB1]AVT37409.1 hypothetical protein C6W10_14075 [Plantactinospora sp. BB1]
MNPPPRVAAALARVRAEAQPRVKAAVWSPTLDPTVILNATARVLQQRRVKWSMPDEELTVQVVEALLLTLGIEPLRPPAGYQTIERPEEGEELDRASIKRSLRSIEQPGGDGKKRPRMLR